MSFRLFLKSDHWKTLVAFADAVCSIIVPGVAGNPSAGLRGRLADSRVESGGNLLLDNMAVSSAGCADHSGAQI